MAQTVPKPLTSREVRLPDTAGPPAPATLRPSPISGSLVTAVVRKALLLHYGSVKAAAYALQGIDESQLTREFDTGRFRLARLDALDPSGRAAVSEALHKEFGVTTDPRVLIARAIRNARQQLDDAAEMLEAV